MPLFDDYGNIPRHHALYCGKKFRKADKDGVEKIYQYLEADYDIVEGKIMSVVRFTDGKSRFTMPEKEFFEKIGYNTNFI